MADAVSKRVLEVEPGLYVLRYLGSIDPRTAPSAIVSAAAVGHGDIDLIAAPGTDPGVIDAPGGSLVVCVRRKGRLEVMLQTQGGSTNLDARLTLDLLAPAKQAAVPFRPTSVSAAPVAASEAGLAPTLRIRAHVSRRGDLVVAEDEWIAGPQSPAAIEGLAFETEGGAVGIAAQFVESREPGRWSAWLAPGAFLGTRQKASPIVGLRLKLVGDASAAFRLDAQALFLGAPVATLSGPEMELTAPGGRDPLIGLRLRLSALPERQAPVEPAIKSRVRVFRQS